MKQMHVALVSQEMSTFKKIGYQLSQEGIATSQADSWQAVFHLDQPHLMLIDRPEPGVAGLSVCQDIRSLYNGLLVLLTDDNDDYLHALAISMGADLSLPCTAGPVFVAAQVKALLRRFARSEPASVQQFGSLTVDANRRDVFVDEKAALLSTVEFNLLWSLVTRAGSVVSRDEIHQDLYSSSYNGYDRGIDLCISRIRQKIGDDPAQPRYLKTVRGAGYQFVAVTHAA